MTLTDTATPGQSGSESNYNEGVLHTHPNAQYQSLIIRCSLVSYSEHPFCR